jgi:hypothetical protein
LVEWARHEFGKLVFLPGRDELVAPSRAKNPKRRQREAARATADDSRMRTTAQAAWHDALTMRKAETASSARYRNADAERRYALRSAKRTKKPRGK